MFGIREDKSKKIKVYPTDLVELALRLILQSGGIKGVEWPKHWVHADYAEMKGIFTDFLGLFNFRMLVWQKGSATFVQTLS